MLKTKDITGQKFGRLVAIRLMDERRNSHTVWECKCDCGNVAYVLYSNLKRGGTNSCGCLQREKASQNGKNSANDITGQKFGRLTAIRPTEQRKRNVVIWECKCDCGNVAYVLYSNLKRGSTKSCGCLSREIRVEDITGQRFGRLVVIRLSDERKDNQTVWECKCDCGNVVLVRNSSLRRGDTKSCGCLQREKASQNGKKSVKDITGQRFERLVAIRPSNKRSNDGSVVWECKCDCGNVVLVQPSHLKSGSVKSCGCFRRESHDRLYLNKQFGLIEDTSVSNIKSQKPRSNSKTGYRGVCYAKGKYFAYMGFKQKVYSLGYFDTLEKAVEVRKQAEKEIYGPFLEWYEKNFANGMKQ